MIYQRLKPTATSPLTKAMLRYNPLKPVQLRSGMGTLCFSWWWTTKYSDTLIGEYEKVWKLAIESELNIREENKTWEPYVLPVGRNTIPFKWIFKRKLNAEGKVCRYTARMMCKGFIQREGVDFSEIFEQVAKFSSIKLLIFILSTI